MLPLQGVKVLELGQLAPGPFAAQVLADYGAEVIKVEMLTGESGRHATNKPVGLHSAARFYNFNRNKKCVALDLKSLEGKTIFEAMTKSCDVLIEQYRPGSMDRLGLGYERLKEINPQLIYASISGWGQTGPYRMVGAHDQNIYGLSGLLSVQGTKEKPILCAAPMCDFISGFDTVIAVLLALRAREQTGEGQYCDIGMLDGLAPLAASALISFWEKNIVPERESTFLNGAAAMLNVYETADNRFVTLVAFEAKLWNNFCGLIGKPEWFNKNMDEALWEEQKAYVAKWFKERALQECIDIFSKVDCAFAPVLDASEAVRHPQIVDRELFYKAENLDGSALTAYLPGLQVRLSKTPGKIVPTWSRVGGDTKEVLKELGYSDHQIAALAEKKVVRA